MIQLSAQAIEFALTNYTIKEQFAGGALYLFAGPIPANADAGLDVVTMHTEIAKIGGGSPGIWLKFDTDALVIDDGYDPWSTTAAFDGFEAAEGSLQAVFFRFCAGSSIAGADNGRSPASPTFKPCRIQGTVGLAASTADLRLGVTTYAPSDPVSIGTFKLRLFGG